MKKAVLFLVIVSLSLFALNGCGSDNNDNSDNKDNNDSGQVLTLDKKYIASRLIWDQDTQHTYTFHDDGSGEYYYYNYYYYNDEEIHKYTINFKYLIIEDTVVCFFDSVVYAAEHNMGDIKTDWNTVFGFSKDIIMSTSGSIYICEDYLPNIPNFGK